MTPADFDEAIRARVCQPAVDWLADHGGPSCYQIAMQGALLALVGASLIGIHTLQPLHFNPVGLLSPLVWPTMIASYRRAERAQRRLERGDPAPPPPSPWISRLVWLPLVAVQIGFVWDRPDWISGWAFLVWAVAAVVREYAYACHPRPPCRQTKTVLVPQGA